MKRLHRYFRVVAKATVLMSSAISLSAVLNPAHAATFNTYSDRSAFDTAVGASVINDLNGLTIGTSFVGTPLDIGDLSLLRSGSSSQGQIQSGGDGFNIDGTNFGRVFTSSAIGDMVFTFENPTTAFGLDVYLLNDIYGPNDVLVRTSVKADGAAMPIGVLSTDSRHFFGFSSDTPFSEVTFVGGLDDDWGFDNITYVSAVPVPAALPMFLSGLVGFGVMARRCKRAARA